MSTDIVLRLRDMEKEFAKYSPMRKKRDTAAEAANTIEAMREALRAIGEWDHRGHSVSEAWDELGEPGDWSALLGKQAE